MEPDYITAFDALHTSNSIQKLKVIHAFSDPDIQHFMAVYIKFLEFQYTLKNHLRYHRFSGSVNTICDALCPFCTPDEQQQLQQLGQFMDSFETMKAVSETMELMKDIFPSGTGEDTASSGSDSPMMEQFLMGMLSDDQRTLFESLLNNGHTHTQ